MGAGLRSNYCGGGSGKKLRWGEALSSSPGDLPRSPKQHRAAPAPREEEKVPEAVVELDPHVIGAISPAGGQDAISELKILIIRLEKTVNAQSRAFRALVDLLQQKGVRRRREPRQRTAKK